MMQALLQTKYGVFCLVVTWLVFLGLIAYEVITGNAAQLLFTALLSGSAVHTVHVTNGKSGP